MGVWQFIHDQALGRFPLLWWDLGSIVLLISIFGVKVTILYVLVGLVIAVVGGTIDE